MIDATEIDRIIGSDAVDQDDDRIGRVSQVYLDSDSERPTWATVRTGLFGTSETLVPLSDASWDDGILRLAVDRASVKGAPRMDPEAEISVAEQERLYLYYGYTADHPEHAGGDPDDDGLSYSRSDSDTSDLDAGLAVDDGADAPRSTGVVGTAADRRLGGERGADVEATGTSGPVFSTEQPQPHRGTTHLRRYVAVEGLAPPAQDAGYEGPEGATR